MTDEMRKYLDYWWCLGVSHTGMPRYVNDRHLQNKWKPIVAFGRAPVPLPPEWLGDFLEGGGRDKAHHRWGQPVSEARYFITRLTEAGDLVVDPFCRRRDDPVGVQDPGATLAGHGDRRGDRRDRQEEVGGLRKAVVGPESRCLGSRGRRLIGRHCRHEPGTGLNR